MDYGRNNNSETSVIPLIASIVALFSFVTGISSLPHLLGFSRSVGLFNDVGISTGTSIGIFLFSQGIYYLFFYLVITQLRGIFNIERSNNVFYVIVFTIIGTGLSLVFFETYWGEFSSIKTSAAAFGAYFYIIISIGLNVVASLFGTGIDF